MILSLVEFLLGLLSELLPLLIEVILDVWGITGKDTRDY